MSEICLPSAFPAVESRTVVQAVSSADQVDVSASSTPSVGSGSAPQDPTLASTNNTATLQPVRGFMVVPPMVSAAGINVPADVSGNDQPPVGARPTAGLRMVPDARGLTRREPAPRGSGGRRA